MYGQTQTQTQTRFATEIAGLPALRREDDNDFATAVSALSAFIRDRERVPAAATGDRAEATLGSWLEDQRAADRRGRLSVQRASVLQGILGPRWS